MRHIYQLSEGEELNDSRITLSVEHFLTWDVHMIPNETIAELKKLKGMSLLETNALITSLGLGSRIGLVACGLLNLDHTIEPFPLMVLIIALERYS